MALVLNDRVKETSTTTSTGTLDLDGAVTGFEGFVNYANLLVEGWFAALFLAMIFIICIIHKFQFFHFY